MKIKLYTLLLAIGLICQSSFSQTPEQETYFPKGSLSIRTNMVSWLALTPSLGVEYKPSDNIGILFDGAFSHWGADHSKFIWRLWNIAPQVRTYLGKDKCNYIGLQYSMGEYNLQQRQGKYMGGGIVLGHQFYQTERFLVDVGITFGYYYISSKEKYRYCYDGGVNYRVNCKTSNGYWGPTSASISFVWKVN